MLAAAAAIRVTKLLGQGVKTLAQIALPLYPSAMTPSPYNMATVSQDRALPYDPNGRAGSRDSIVLRAIELLQ